MTSVQLFQRRVSQVLEAAGLTPDQIESYGRLVTFKKQVDHRSSKFYAWQILETLPDSNIHDHFEARALDGKDYFVVRFIPGNLPKSVAKPKQRQPKPQPKPELKPEPQPVPVPDPEPAFQPGQIAWAVVPKRGGEGLKQSRCEIVSANGHRVEVRITKTNQQLTVSTDNVFDHVPRLIEGVWQ